MEEGFWDQSSEEEDTDNLTAKRAGELLVDMLCDLNESGKLSTMNMCLLAFYANKAGAIGEVGAIGMAPGKRSGAYQRHIDQLTQYKDTEQDYYDLRVPGHGKYDLGRFVRAMPVRPAHEDLHNEFLETPNLEQILGERRAMRECPPKLRDAPSRPSGVWKRSASLSFVVVP